MLQCSALDRELAHLRMCDGEESHFLNCLTLLVMWSEAGRNDLAPRTAEPTLVTGRALLSFYSAALPAPSLICTQVEMISCNILHPRSESWNWLWARSSKNMPLLFPQLNPRPSRGSIFRARVTQMLSVGLELLKIKTCSVIRWAHNRVCHQHAGACCGISGRDKRGWDDQMMGPCVAMRSHSM